MKPRHIFTLVLMALAAVMLAGSFAYYGTAAFGFPFAVSSIVLVMTGLLFAFELRAERVVKAPEDAHLAAAEKPIDWPGLARIYALLVLFLVISHFASYLIAVPLFLFAMAFWLSREGWLPSATLAIGAGACIWVLFDQLLHSF